MSTILNIQRPANKHFCIDLGFDEKVILLILLSPFKKMQFPGKVFFIRNDPVPVFHTVILTAGTIACKSPVSPESSQRFA